MATSDTSVVVVGGGVAGLSAALYTGRAGLQTTVVSTGDSILRRNAHLENYPGFPAGINPRLLLDLLEEQVADAGVTFADGRIQRVTSEGDGFELLSADGDSYDADYVIAASWADATYLEGLDVEFVDRGSKTFVGVDDFGSTTVEGLYAAGRLAEQHHQTVVAAGHGAQVGIAVVEDSDVDFYHDWTVPEGYFTGRGREVPPGCEEIDEAEREDREAASLERMREAFAEPHPEAPTMHPSVAEDE
ncbi:NAD(P)/FAD-dependent oxidoreductase [Haloarcula salinisoli]|uniref:FAD-dependent oxidoreductase n=1 Tax=Haloarcula salinisoli TaxID=2487746 RepID=A0A8J7YGX9_9EURY|nr:FAD-dependent oxidoreductase [Halomicroarcula salinisoli]MBX0285683.1 FAD-dependent oxidoreductase [Halomicroarcula salinisoli]MBX0302829.1 FAD-dependent oxidoreductase [Halomicroarcula salinisoli]